MKSLLLFFCLFYSAIVLIFFCLISVKENNWARSFQTMKGAYATKGNQWVSYNDVQFVKEKADYVIKNKYGGVAVFTMDMDDFNNNCCQVRFIEIKWLYINFGGFCSHFWYGHIAWYMMLCLSA